MLSHYVVQGPLIDDAVDLLWFCRVCHHEWPVTQVDAGVTPDRSTEPGPAFDNREIR
jgi:hypothetical protein